MRYKKGDLRLMHLCCLWVVQERRTFLWIPYWKDIFSSPFLEEIQEFVIKKQYP